MDPARRAASNHGDDDGEVHIVVDLSHQLSPNNGHNDRENSDANRRNGNRNRVLGIDLNGPAMKDFEAEYPDTPLPSPVADAPGQNYTGFESAFDGYIDWGRGSIDVAPDGRLAYYESAPAPVANGNGNGNGNGDRGREFDLNAAVQEAQNQDEAYYQNRLENLRNGGGGGGDFQVDDDQDLDLNFNNTAGEDQSVPLWYH